MTRWRFSLLWTSLGFDDEVEETRSARRCRDVFAPFKDGIKLLWVCDAETNYPLVAEPYLCLVGR